MSKVDDVILVPFPSIARILGLIKLSPLKSNR